MKAYALIAGLFWFTAFSCFADEAEGESSVVQEAEETEGPAAETEDSRPRSLILGARVDAAFTAGGQVQQGFSIPSLRLTAFGDIGKHLDYRLSVGQTREYSTVLLPQLLPIEAFINLSSDVESKQSHLHWRLGMFRPTINPWWTPDLTLLLLPDHNEIHKAALLNNDIGTEICIQPVLDRLEVSVGAFNGNGILSQNSNNTRSFVGFVRGGVRVKESKIQGGLGTYYLTQSAMASVNYKTQYFFDLFFGVETPLIQTGIDFISGNYEDNTRELTPYGGSAFLTIAFLPSLKLFSRFEALKNSPVSGGDLTHLQVGPIWELDALRVFVTYQSLDSGAGAREDSGQVRVRMAL